MKRVPEEIKKYSRYFSKGKVEDEMDRILVKSRQIILFDELWGEKTEEIIKKLLTLDKINNKPVYLWINCPGGNVSYGWSIVDIMNFIKSPIITIVNGKAYSMAGIISITGTKRYMTSKSIWMSHDMSGGIWGDYTEKVIDRAEFLRKEQERLFKYLSERTKLTGEEIKKARTGELWLNPYECKEKGIIDHILYNKEDLFK